MFHAPLSKPDLRHANPFAHYWAWFCSWVLIRVKFSAHSLNNGEICSLLASCRKLVYKINQSSIYRRKELKYRTKVKWDDFKLWLIQIVIFVLYVKLVKGTTFAEAHTVTRLWWKTFRSFTKKESLVSILREFVTLIRTYYQFWQQIEQFITTIVSRSIAIQN